MNKNTAIITMGKASELTQGGGGPKTEWPLREGHWHR